MRTADVLVVGAGPTGLVLALSLARRGVPVRVIDRKPGPTDESRAIGVQARTLEFYRQLGIADAVVRDGVPADAVHLREHGADVARLTLGDMGAGLSPYPFLLCYPQDRHEHVLVAQLEAAGVRVEWGTELTGFAEHGDGVRAALVHDGAAQACDVAYLCGADGAHSRVRHGLGVAFAGETGEQLFYVADVRLAPNDPGADVYLNVDGRRGVGMLFPVGRDGTKRLLGVVPPDAAAKAAAGGPPLTYEDVRPYAEPLVGAHVAEVCWFATYRVSHRVAERFRAGRCFLLGDAGHIHSPVGGQGMNTGIGDAVNLAWKLAHVLQGRADASVLDTYEAERVPFARALVGTTDAAFKRLVARGPGAAFLREWVLPRAVAVAGGFDGTRRRLFELVSQVHIRYRDSALSAGAAGAIHGGDRLPWVAAVDDGAEDNFAPLAALDWQAHVYGAPRPALGDAAAALGLPLHAFPWTAAARAAGLAEGALYLVRPDGYVALASREPSAGVLDAFARQRGLRFARLTPPTPA